MYGVSYKSLFLSNQILHGMVIHIFALCYYHLSIDLGMSYKLPETKLSHLMPPHRSVCLEGTPENH